MILEKLLRGFEQVRVERAREARVAGKEDQVDALHLAHGKPRTFRSPIVGLRGGRKIRQHFAHQIGVGTRRNDALLGAAQFRGRDHFHGLGDLLRVFHGADAPPQIDQTRHSELTL